MSTALRTTSHKRVWPTPSKAEQHPQLELPAIPTKDIDHLSTVPPSIVAYKKYGVRVSELYYTLHNIWSIHKHSVSHCLTRVHLLYWKPSYLLAKVKDGTIRHQGRTYCVIYKGITPGQLRKYTGQIALSFRVPAPEFNLFPVVLIAPATTPTTTLIPKDTI